MVHKFIRDHAWKFPSMPPLTLMWGAKGILEKLPDLIPGVSGGSLVHKPRLN
ncbi:MAG: hypothetical protein HQ475_00260 [SAR202 cluster bacterium]|nr:hypothetical protein [SAR202 cluster bacterium]